MSLIHWWTLDNTLKDNCTIATLNAASNFDFGTGKVTSKAGLFSANTYLEQNINLTSEMTFACWVRFNATGSYHIIDCRTSNIGYQPIFVEVNGDIQGRLQIHSSEHNTGDGSADFPYTFKINTWYHLAAVYTENNVIAYVNGTPLQSKNSNIVYGTNIFNTKPITIGIRHSHDNYRLNGIVNDIRIYDEALSPIEIKELSKGLCLKYSFDGYTTDTDILPIYHNFTLCGADFRYRDNIIENVQTDTKDNFQFQVQYQITGGWVSPIAVDILETNKQYLYKFTVPKNNTTGKVRIKHNGSIKDLFIANSEDGMPISYGKSYAISFYCINNDPTTTGGIQLQNLKIVELPDIQDDSGYSHNGIIAPMTYLTNINATYPACETDPKFGNVLRLEESDIGFHYINININPKIITNGTISIWYKKATDSAPIILADLTAVNIAAKGWVGAINSTEITNTTANNGPLASFKSFYIDGKLARNGPGTATIPNDTEWHHYCITGVDISAANNCYFNSRNTSWTIKGGKIFDYRIYSTKLSAEDVKDLYENSAIITNKQELLAPKTKENSTITNGIELSNKVFATPEVIEGGPENYDNLYRPIEYIESTGTQYIDTGITASLTNKYILKISKQTESGGTLGSDDHWGGFLMYNSTRNGYRFHLPNSHWDLNNLVDDTIEINCSTNGLFINGQSGTEASDNNQYAGTLKLYPKYQGGYSRGKFKLYYCKLYNNDTIVRDFVPVVRILDNKPGLYDLIEHKFYTNQGNGEFLIEGISSEYKQLDYIESTGTQYIDTGITYDNSKSIKVILKQLYTTTQPTHQIIGFTGNRGCGIGTQESSWWEITNPAVVCTDTIYNIEWYKNANEYYRVINGIKTTGNDGNTSIPEDEPLLLFAAWNSYNNKTIAYFCSAKLYSCQIYQDNILIRDYAPVIKSLTGEVGLYDKVNHIFYTNHGEGKFSYFDNLNYIATNYLQSTGTQFIDTGFIPNQNTSVKVTYTSQTDQADKEFVFGSRTSYFESGIAHCVNFRNHYFAQFGNTYWEVGDAYTKNTVQQVAINKHIYTQNDTERTTSGAVFNCLHSLLLFACFDFNTSGVYGCSHIKLYDCEIWDGDKLVRHFKPAVRKTDAKPGLYDMTNHKFYTNEGTGEFEILTALDYLPANYIESTGTQYIDTGIEITGNLKTQLDFAFSSYDNDERYVFGFDSPTVIGMISGHGRIYEFGAERYSWPLDTNRHTAIIGKNIVFDGTIIASSISGSSTGKNGFLFCSNTANGARYYSKTKLYSCKIWDNGVLVRDFIPAISGTTNKPGLYDKINNKFYGNQGTGEFLVSAPISEFREIDYIKCDGKQWIDTSYNLVQNSAWSIDFALTDTANGHQIAGVHGGPVSQITTWEGDICIQNADTDITTGMGRQPIDLNRHLIYIAQGNQTFDGVQCSTMSYTTNAASSLFIGTRSGTPNINPIKAKFYGAKVWTGDSLARDFVPAIRKSDNKPGLYDKIEEKFYINQGVGEFKHSDNDLSYIEVEYIESDGNQFIDTGVTWEANKSLTYELSQQFITAAEDIGSGHHRCLFGETASGNFKAGTIETSTKGTETGHICKAVWSATVTATSPVTVSYYFDGVLIGENHYADGHYDTRPYFLFACPSWSGDNTGRPPAYFSTTRVYRAKFYKGTTLVRDFIPVIRKSDGKPCLYDLVEHKFYVNQGTKDFISGPIYKNNLNEVQVYKDKTLVNKIGEI